MPAESYQTLTTPVEAEFRDRGSRFLGFAFPVRTVAEAKQTLAEKRKEHPKAVHHCLAYRIGDDFRASDDGEPSGSAGRPMLGAIDSARLDYTAAIVVRYFGGTLLGVPGLIHAYRTAVADALAKGEPTTRWMETSYEIVCDYGLVSEVLRVLRMQGATMLQQEMQLFCTLVAGIRPSLEPAFLAAMAELPSATVKKI
ncbi:MAG: YigZ family protein [Sphingobacteriales bacterium]|nr:MAG: YigZ family protein [Sphingobacteriales bacterium]